MTQGASREQQAFVVMPFAADFDDVYAAIREAVRAVDESIRAVRLDEVRAARVNY
jgi:hypothetical protein